MGGVGDSGSTVDSDVDSNVAAATADLFSDLRGSDDSPEIWSPTNEILPFVVQPPGLPLPPVHLSADDVAATVQAVMARLTQTPVAVVVQPTDVLVSGNVRAPDTRAGGVFVTLTPQPSPTPTNGSIAKAEATTKSVATAFAEASLTAARRF